MSSSSNEAVPSSPSTLRSSPQRKNNKPGRTQITRTSEHSNNELETITQNNDLGSMIAQLSLSAITVTLYIPTTAVGAVIGRRGQTIAHLQKTAAQAASNPKTPVRISVREPETPTYTPLDPSNELWTPVVIKADPLAAWSACEQIQTLVENNGEDLIVDIPLHRNKHATVVGKRGWTVATLSADHAVRILVPHKELRHDVVQLEGQLMNVRACFAALVRVLVAPATLHVPVLPPQTKLRHIGRKTDTVLRKTKLDDGTWQLTVTGAGHVPAAVAMLQKWKEELQYPHAKQQQQQSRKQPRGSSKAVARKSALEVSN